MPKYTLVVMGLDFEKNQIEKICQELELNCFQLEFFPDSFADLAEQRSKILEYSKEQARAVIIKSFTMNPEREKFYQKLRAEAGAVPLIPIGAEAIQAGIYNIDLAKIQEINRYFIYGGLENLANALRFIGREILGIPGLAQAAKPEPVVFEGIFHPEAQTVFPSWESYARWYQDRYPGGNRQWVGLLTHRNNWLNDNLAVETALIRELENLGLGVVPVFNYGSAEPELKTKDFDETVEGFFCHDGRLVIEALINLHAFVLRSDSSGRDIFEQAVAKLQQLDIPVIKPLVSYMSSRENWEENRLGLTLEIPWSFTVPEFQGMIEPVLIGCRNEEGKTSPVPDRINKLARRVEKLLALKRVPNRKKRLAVFLHNAPCSGVEATVGRGAGLDVFSSTINILRELQKSGWTVNNLPAGGRELHKLIMDRKAYVDFRWTSVEDIVDSGGCLYPMPLEGSLGYYEFYAQLDPQCREEMENTWGPPPGEGMVYGNKLVITGINFGNVTVLVQPKRGCYGAKCTGEVCKILQDPNCPPPHHYLATYKFVEEIFQAQAVLHVGTHGSLEFLPGKANALSGSCYPDLILGSIPNLYIYNAGVGTEGILAKRRSNAVILDHLPGVYGVPDSRVRQLLNLIVNYLEAVNIRSGQVQTLETLLREQIPQIPGAGTIIERARTFSEGLSELKKTLVQAICYPRSEKPHIYGGEKTMEDILWYIKEVLQSDVKLMTSLRSRWPEEYGLHNLLLEFIWQVLTWPEQSGRIIIQTICRDSSADDILGIFDGLALEIREISAKLSLVPLEMAYLLHALNGGYIPPGPSGMPDDNGKNIIPTGRNFYLMDIAKIPTKAAWKVGCRLADQLLDLFRAEEGRYPEKIAMNMISLDISRTNGEQLSQILYLMGIRPVWDEKGKVIDLEVIPLEQLQRPRIDVTVRISGVLRDSFPQAVELLDRAVNMAAVLPEAEDLNLIKKHTSRLVKALQDAGEESELQRRSTLRIFGDRPGTYGAGVDLALKASAWKDEQDLAKVFVYFSSYAYGESLNGRPAGREFIENVKNVQVSYDTSNSKRYDILASCFGASVQGGFGLITKVIQGKEIRQYYGSRENPEEVKVSPLAEKLQETLEERLFNPLWKENMRQKGYQGAAELMIRLQNVFAWQCLTESIAHTSLDRLAEEYVNDPAMRSWFRDNNLFALEEIARRFLELQERAKWQADPEVLAALKNNYLELEGDLEGRIGEVKGEIQAGGIEVLNAGDVKEWQDRLKEVNALFDRVQKSD